MHFVMHSAAREETFVVIAGGGPVGLTAAIALGRRGVPVVLLNERLETATHPKCNNTNARTMEHLRRLGVAEDIHRASLPPLVAREYAYVTRFCGYEFARMGRPHPYMDGGRKVGGNADFLRSPETPQYIPQTSLEPILKEHAERQTSVSVRFGWRVVGVTETSTGVDVTAESVTSGERRSIGAQYVIAADGARSLVRRELGIEMAGEDGTVERAFMTGTMLSHHIRAPKLLEQSGRPPALITWITNHEARGFFFAQDARERWIVHYQVPRGVDWRTLDPRAVVRKMIGADTEFEILSGGPWTGGLALVAERYQTGRIFLVGDAAHLYTPLGAFGMNTGVGDAMNICWKLAAVHAGWAGADLLRSYEAERRPIGIRNARHGITCAQRQSAWPIPADIEENTPQADAGRSVPIASRMTRSSTTPPASSLANATRIRRSWWPTARRHRPTPGTATRRMTGRARGCRISRSPTAARSTRRSAPTSRSLYSREATPLRSRPPRQRAAFRLPWCASRPRRPSPITAGSCWRAPIITSPGTATARRVRWRSSTQCAEPALRRSVASPPNSPSSVDFAGKMSGRRPTATALTGWRNRH